MFPPKRFDISPYRVGVINRRSIEVWMRSYFSYNNSCEQKLTFTLRRLFHLGRIKTVYTTELLLFYAYSRISTCFNEQVTKNTMFNLRQGANYMMDIRKKNERSSHLLSNYGEQSKWW
ncbi:unnamed protein product [Ascophyllum nodosum]